MDQRGSVYRLLSVKIVTKFLSLIMNLHCTSRFIFFFLCVCVCVVFYSFHGLTRMVEYPVDLLTKKVKLDKEVGVGGSF